MPRAFKGLPQRLFQATIEDAGIVRVVGQGRIRQLWFVEPSGHAHLQTEMVMEGGRATAGEGTPDINASLRRTPYLACVARVLAPLLVQLPYSRAGTRSLVLGLGGGLLPWALRKFGGGQDKILVVEQSELVIDLARRFFGIAQAERDGWLQVHCGDAAEFVEQAACQANVAGFHACGIDIYEGHSCMLPNFLFSSKFQRGLRALLLPGAHVAQCALAHDGEVEIGRAAGCPWPRRSGNRDFDAGKSMSASDSSARVKCFAWCRNGAPRGPLSAAFFPRHNAAGDQLELLTKAYTAEFGRVTVHRPSAWVPSRVLDVSAVSI